MLCDLLSLSTCIELLDSDDPITVGETIALLHGTQHGHWTFYRAPLQLQAPTVPILCVLPDQTLGLADYPKEALKSREVRSACTEVDSDSLLGIRPGSDTLLCMQGIIDAAESCYYRWDGDWDDEYPLSWGAYHLVEHQRGHGGDWALERLCSQFEQSTEARRRETDAMQKLIALAQLSAHFLRLSST